MKRLDTEYKREIRKFWISTPKVTGQVNVDARGLICQTPPVWRRFMRHPLSALTNELKKTSHVQIETLPKGPELVQRKEPEIEYWIETIQNEGENLTDWEEKFIESISFQFEKYGRLSPKQIEILERIYANKTK